MKWNILMAVVTATLVLTSCMPVTREAGQRINGKGSAPEFVVTITRSGSYALCGRPETEPDIRAYLPVEAMRAPQPTLRAFVEGGIETAAGSKALHTLLTEASDFGITHIVIDRPDPYSTATAPGC
ncbi:hypothetical protein [Rhodanobacter hydrolyticus]|uniref:Lipoprotein n=1 Tax=Rhodanobacter hydrolyticus TaxID=2250595 RepID=A0ABW8J887_9GAMM